MMYKYFLAACVAALCTADFSFAMNTETQENADYQVNLQEINKELDRIAEYLPEDETDGFLLRQRAFSSMVYFAKKNGIDALHKEVDNFLVYRQGQWTSAPIKKLCNILYSGEPSLSDEDFVSEQIDKILADYGSKLEKTDMDNLPELRQVAIDFVSKKGQEALTEEINKYRIKCAKIHGAIISRFVNYLQGAMNN